MATKQMECLIWGYLRTNIESQFKHLIIPNDIKLIILNHVGKLFIDSVILSDDEKSTLYSLLKKRWNTSFITFDLVYRGTRDTFSPKAFYTKCNIINNLIIISTEQTPNNNVFGGFTKLKWNENDGKYGKDKDAFLFLIRSSANYPSGIFDIKPDKITFAIQPDREAGYLCSFGDNTSGNTHDIWLKANNGGDTGSECGDSYKVPIDKGKYYLTGNNGKCSFKYKEIETFQMSWG